MKTLVVYALFILTLFSFSFKAKAQEQKSEKESKVFVGYYYFDSGSIGVGFNASKFQPEIRFNFSESTYFKSYFTKVIPSVYLRTSSNINKKYKIKLSYGLGATFEDIRYDVDVYCKLPVYLVKKDIFFKNLDLMFCVEGKSDFSNTYELLKGVGVAYNF